MEALRPLCAAIIRFFFQLIWLWYQCSVGCCIASTGHGLAEKILAFSLNLDPGKDGITADCLHSMYWHTHRWQAVQKLEIAEQTCVKLCCC